MAGRGMPAADRRDTVSTAAAAILPRTVRAIAAAGLALLAAACFVSHEPLIGPEESVTPLSPGVYALYETENRDTPSLEWRGKIHVRADGLLTSPSPDFGYEGARLARLRRGVWIVQHPPEPDDEDAGYVYTLLYADTETRGRYFVELPMCDVLSPATRTTLGLSLLEESCEIETLDTLREALLAYETERADSLPAFPEGLSYLVREGDL